MRMEGIDGEIVCCGGGVYNACKSAVDMLIVVGIVSHSCLAKCTTWC